MYSEQIDEDQKKTDGLRVKNLEYIRIKDEEHRERDRDTNTHRQPPPSPTPRHQHFKPIDSLKPSHSLHYKMSIPEKDIWKEGCLSWFEASGFEACNQKIQVQFLYQIVREDMLNAVKHQFRDDHDYKELVDFIEKEFMKYHTLDNSL